MAEKDVYAVKDLHDTSAALRVSFFQTKIKGDYDAVVLR